METIPVELVLIAVAILANGFFAGSEIALVSARTSRLAQLRQEAKTGAAKVVRQGAVSACGPPRGRRKASFPHQAPGRR